MQQMPPKDEAYTTLKIKIRTKRELLRMQAGYQLETGEKITVDKIIWTFIQSQPKFDVKMRVTNP